MTTYDNLPVYKESYDVLVAIFQTAKKFSREYKYTLGESLRHEVVTLITNIYRANTATEQRATRIQAARENVELVRLYLRILRDLHEIDLDTFVVLSTKVESVSKQLSGWQRKWYSMEGQSQAHYGVSERAQ
jgi:hypothetical protein